MSVFSEITKTHTNTHSKKSKLNKKQTMAMAVVEVHQNSPSPEPISSIFPNTSSSTTITFNQQTPPQPKTKRPYKRKTTKKGDPPPDPAPASINPAATYDQQLVVFASPSKSTKRSKRPGVRLIGARIYDSEHGKSCHQCRQKTMDFAVSCKNKNKKKQCTLNFCCKCLVNRYGENAEELARIEHWACPKCQGVCNCSFCMKKRGYHPTGILVHTAKANGFLSVSDMIHISVKSSTEEGTSSKKRVSKSKNKGLKVKKLKNHEAKQEPEEIRQDATVSSETAREAEVGRAGSATGLEGDIDSESQFIILKIPKNENDADQVTKLETLGKCDGNAEMSSESEDYIETDVSEESECEEDSHEEIPLPQGTRLNTVANTVVQEELAGEALQLIKFCEAFGKVLELTDGDGEIILSELASADGTRKIDSAAVRLHIKLMTTIQQTSRKEYSSIKARARNAWVGGLRKCVAESEDPSKEMLLGFLDLGTGGYEQLDFSKRLRLLNFLCDEALGSAVLRNWIDCQNAEYAKELKRSKEIVFPGQKEKEKEIKRRIRNEIATAIMQNNSTPLTISEHENLVRRIKAEASQTLAVTLEESETMMKTSLKENNPRSDAVRSEPLLVDARGRTFWKFGASVLSQETGTRDEGICDDTWYAFDNQEKAIVENYILSRKC